MNEEENTPFFINTRRLQRADSYFDIGRAQEKLRKLLVKHNSRVVGVPSEDLEECASVGFYGVNRFLSLDPDPGEGNLDDEEFIEVDEDVQYENTSAFSLFWMTFKRIALSIAGNLLKSENPHHSLKDLESNKREETHVEELCKVLVEPSFHDQRMRQSRIIYGDINYLIQKFRMDLNGGSLDIALFSVEFPKASNGSFQSTDLQAYVVSPDCGSYVWIEENKASAIFMTKSSEDFFGNVMEWFRKILSDMALADSVMIGHPYYWNSTVRRRLTRVMKYLKRLYRNLAMKEKERHKGSPSGIRTDAIEVICPTDVSKVVINEQRSENLLHTTSTHEKLNIMLEQLVKKWFQYQSNLEQSPKRTITDISRVWALNNPQSVERGVKTRGEREFLESVTFLDFHPEKRENFSQGKESLPCRFNGKDDSNNNLPMGPSSTGSRTPSVGTELNISESLQLREGCPCSSSSKRLASSFCIDIDEDLERDKSVTALPPQQPPNNNHTKPKK